MMNMVFLFTVIRSFLAKRWVELKQDESDRRNKHIQLTESGETIAKQVIEAYWNVASDAFSELKSNAREIMIQALNTFSRSFSEKFRG